MVPTTRNLTAPPTQHQGVVDSYNPYRFYFSHGCTDNLMTFSFAQRILPVGTLVFIIKMVMTTTCTTFEMYNSVQTRCSMKSKTTQFAAY